MQPIRAQGRTTICYVHAISCLQVFGCFVVLSLISVAQVEFFVCVWLLADGGVASPQFAGYQVLPFSMPLPTDSTTDIICDFVFVFVVYDAGREEERT